MPRRSDKNKKPLSYLSDNFIFTHRHQAVKPCIAKKSKAGERQNLISCQTEAPIIK
jgi:hypothetical protein